MPTEFIQQRGRNKRFHGVIQLKLNKVFMDMAEELKCLQAAKIW